MSDAISSDFTRLWKPALTVAGALAMGACVPQPLVGTYTPLQPEQVTHDAAIGSHVRWGGTIVKTLPEANRTCFYVMSHPLDDSARPLIYDTHSHGLFVACHPGSYSPKVFATGREVTVTGTVHGIVSRNVGTRDYIFPRVNADSVYLWAKRPRLAQRQNTDSHYRDMMYTQPSETFFYSPPARVTDSH